MNSLKVTVVSVFTNREGELLAVVKHSNEEREIVRLNIPKLYDIVESQGFGHTDDGFLKFRNVVNMSFNFDDIVVKDSDPGS